MTRRPGNGDFRIIMENEDLICHINAKQRTFTSEEALIDE